ncbi:Fc.00g099180.m01.CDS01 [Cosmosporella sp. VM-42]
MEKYNSDQNPTPRNPLPTSQLRADGEEAAVPNPLFPTKGTGRWHHLLKKSASGPMTINKDLPIPPVLSPASAKMPAPRSDAPVEPEYHEDPLITKSSEVPSTTVPGLMPDYGAAAANLPSDERICLGPEFHLNETHGHAHHPGLLKGADFCYAGVAIRGVADAVPSSSNSSSGDSSSDDSDDFSERSGETHELLPEGGLSITKVKVKVPRHEGHSHAVKVRPTSRFDPLYRPITPDDDQGIRYERSQNKVRPFDLKLESQTSLKDDEDIASPTLGSPGVAGCEESVQSMPVSKARVARIATPHPEAHEGHEPVSKEQEMVNTNVPPEASILEAWKLPTESPNIDGDVSKGPNIHQIADNVDAPLGGPLDEALDQSPDHAENTSPTSQLEERNANNSSKRIQEDQMTSIGDGHQQKLHGNERADGLSDFYRVIEGLVSLGSGREGKSPTKDAAETTSKTRRASQTPKYPAKAVLDKPLREEYTIPPQDTDNPVYCSMGHSLEDDPFRNYNTAAVPIHYLETPERTRPSIGHPENKFEEVYSHPFVQAPIPVSGARAGILEPVVISAQIGHGVASEARTTGEKPYKEQSERYFRVDSDTSLRAEHGNVQRGNPPSPSGRSQSLGSVLDYGSPTRWLRNLLKQPQSYTSRFTEIPDRDKSIGVSVVDTRRPSEPALPSNTVSRRQTGKSTFSNLSGPHVDRLGFKRAVSDLERLLGEALSLATQVVERSETSPQGEQKRPSTDSHPHHYSRLLLNIDDEVSSSNQPFISAHETVDELSDVDLDEQVHSKRPRYKHAVTYSGARERPRLADLIERYSQANETGGTGDFETHSRSQSRLCGFEEPTPVHVPCRKSSKNIAGRSASELCRSVITQEVLGLMRKGCEAREEDVTGNTTVIDFNVGNDNRRGDKPSARHNIGHHTPSGIRSTGEAVLPERNAAGRRMHTEHGISLRRRSHVSLRNTQGFSLVKSHKRKPIARDWSPVRKRFVAAVACLSTALVGMLLGIYAGLVPSIQYYIVDQSHVTIHGNTGCFLGLAMPTFFLWPLPLLHGRKPYIMSSLALAMPLLFPQALAVNSQRLINTGSWRAMLIASRTLMGAALGFASMNFHSTLTDLFGASLMSHNPHQEVVDRFDARRHGGGMGVWLGMWTWCWVGSLGIGFLIGAAIIDRYPPAWGFYISIILIAVVLLLNVVCPEVRRSAFRRSVTEVRTGSDISRRLARGEVMMHRVKTGPKWWGEEVHHGIILSFEMLCQPGFAVMAVYVAWIYAQVVLIIVLLGSLASQHYHLHATYVGLLVAGVSFGGLLAIPFQKANIFSRSRHFQFDTSRATLENTVTWSSHLIRRAVVVVALPLAGGCYAAVSMGPPLSIAVPTFFAICVGFLSCLAVAECNGLIMETFDTSDLSPGMTGRPRGASGENQKRTNYSSFPRATAGFAVIHTFAFIFAAGSTALGGHITRTLGQQVATAVVAGILFVLTVLLLLILVRFKNVLIVPRSRSAEMDKLCDARRRSTLRRMSMPNNPKALMEEANAWRPFMIGNPVGKNRRMNVLELGGMTRWQDIRRKNKLIDEGVNLNRAALDQGLEALGDAPVFRMGSGKRYANRMRRSDQGSSDPVEMDILNFGPSLALPEQHQYPERDCFMGQTVKEEGEEEAQAGPSDHR